MVRPKKHLGQHFLNNQRVAAQIADALTGQGYSQVVEIGPGMGVLTKFLKERKEELYLVEIDGESVNYLHRHFDLPYDHILEADFLRLPLARIFDHPVAVIGNFPYNISSQIIFKVLENKDRVPELVGMFQKEVAERIVAGPGSKTYGVISVLTAAYYEREYLFTVAATEFKPPRKVQSGVIRLKRKQQRELGADENLFRLVVKTAFNQRRKTLKNALKALNLPADMAQDPLLTKRAEQLGLEDFVYITNSLQN
ncbi:MAG: 16S rRNA (adenine(1518)-N(6)/adenine(1519)-N(6))-dimethyltransferase RsmA [Owenweeksia sp.]|nr:16S rRNA (adenine(1518)-N(6)/adenine(1519)-N(6))-dimethyltransferase RsmA [Owenweeksia sp.]